MSNEDVINDLIRSSRIDTNKISDGYHTFKELYDHRIVLYLTLCRILESSPSFRQTIWKSRIHSDGKPAFDGNWFVLGINTEKGEQITYHLPNKYWSLAPGIEMEICPEFDGHTSSDVLNRLQQL